MASWMRRHTARLQSLSRSSEKHGQEARRCRTTEMDTTTPSDHSSPTEAAQAGAVLRRGLDPEGCDFQKHWRNVDSLPAMKCWLPAARIIPPHAVLAMCTWLDRTASMTA
jgi:hypothetical protein